MRRWLAESVAGRVWCESLEGRRLLDGVSRAIFDAVDDAMPVNTSGNGGLVKRARASGDATPNLAITGLVLVDANNNASTPVVGQMIFVRATWNASGLNVGQQYVVRFSVDNVVVDSGTVAHNGDGGYYWYRGGWYASPGTHVISATIDGAGVIAESSESDNTSSFNAKPDAPTTLPAKMIQPIGRVRNVDWRINNYADVDPRTSTAADYRGGAYQYEGHDAIDAGPFGSFAAQDNGISLHAAIAGTVVQVLDGNFDRENAFVAGHAGNYVLLDHGGGWQTLYYHFAANTITVKVGEVVKAGQVLGLMGSSGQSTGTHVHFTLIKGGAVVESQYAPEEYWISPPPYAGDVPTALLRSGTSNYNDFNEHAEGISTIETFSTQSPTSIYYWFHIANMQAGDTLSIKWYRPDGSLSTTQTNVTPELYRFVMYQFNIPSATWTPYVGAWQVAVSRNGVELDRRPFNVISAAGKPEAKLLQGTKVIRDGRTTAIDLGTTNLGNNPGSIALTLTNHGFAPLLISGVSLPPGVNVTQALPATIPAGGSAPLWLNLSTFEPGKRFGEVAILTNDEDESRYTFNVGGTVTGTLAQSPPNLSTTNSSGVPFRVGASPKVLDASLVVTNGSSADYSNATLAVQIFGTGYVAGDGLTVVPGNGVTVQGTSILFNGIAAALLANVPNGLAIVFVNGTVASTVQAVARQVGFTSTSSETGRRYVRMTVNQPSTNSVFGGVVVKTIVFDHLPRPTFTSAAATLELAQAVKFNFSSSVAGSVTASDLALTNAATNLPVAATVQVFADPDGKGITFRLQGPGGALLPDGNYIARLTAAGITDDAGLPLAEDVSLSFTLLGGDANGDRKVDFDDLVILAQNYGLSGKTFSQGNFNYSADGKVDFDDLVILAQKYNTSLALAAELAIPLPPTAKLPTKRSGGKLAELT